MNRNECPTDFLRGYIDAALFTTDEKPGSGDYVESGRAQVMWPRVPDSFLVEAAQDCAVFQEQNQHSLAGTGNDWQNGADFWYSRNGHGVGFDDRGYGVMGEVLQKAAAKWGEVYLELDRDLNLDL